MGRLERFIYLIFGKNQVLLLLNLPKVLPNNVIWSQPEGQPGLNAENGNQVRDVAQIRGFTAVDRSKVVLRENCKKLTC